jgi:hypothetical protein
MSQGDRQGRTLRYPFDAPAEVIPESSGAPFAVSVKELGLSGCYLETPAPFSPETRVLLKIFGPGNYFESNATVTQSEPGLGMGLVFRDVKPHFFGVLRNWVFGAMRDNPKNQK